MEKALTHTYAQVVQKAWQDENFKQKLINDPVETLRHEGIEVPEGTNITVCEETENQHFIFIPKKPEGEFSEEELESIAGGGWKHFQQYMAEGDLEKAKAEFEHINEKRIASGQAPLENPFLK